MFRKILIANRGEVAVRIIRACKDMGISTVAVYSEADSEALHVGLADESICIGKAPAADSYLNMQAILSAAAVTHVQAIHPGYGFLAESAKFASLCEQCNIRFIGPDSTHISSMGDKDNARKTMKKMGLPVVPGSESVEDLPEAFEWAGKIGYPLLIKARAGGGGRGIRLVAEERGFERAFLDASREASASFGDAGLYIEKYMEQVRHIEVQILADAYGKVVCLGERDCSMQRRKQKVLEESPAAGLPEETRKNMQRDAVRAAKKIGYANAGTLEFLVDAHGNHYFMEMNTRLQVEHPVTEMVTGVDLVKWQIRIAAGVPLSFDQRNIRMQGHSIECRINAENPAMDFRPSSGTVEFLHIPGGPRVRFDTALYPGCTVPPYYDSLLGKLVVHADTREEAVRKMQAALAELVITGVETNIELHIDILAGEAFRNGAYTTGYLESRNES
ncbi:MAG: acetyl-CoA carboxylase biotin carboxylase subunit [Bacillota bacterium]|nr:acetyl-CoA carboxylase biotin carboxylase subunit [Eubacteriales bacterium]MDI9491398.1 acetyl-CoA carboxylase biotin carboxylase subunit [Bacillota bacterium]HRV33501.1 acetyl-CoA carboxylase biotin carboxylase subunit [Anaerovoracaceae bacterium]MDD3536679.1 acetyl-CoA carboxylase biotin carboxylase subunit [Eubacteriales bacterium]MDD4286579.1 acetyl-CoA carboxylase biotin carboxylase subunit [Eubacteriales bacterium]